MRSPASARPEPGSAGREEEGERERGGEGRGSAGGRAPLPLAPGTRLSLQPRPASPASRAAGPISARGGSRALRGARSLAGRARPNSGRVGLSSKSANSGRQELTAPRRWGAPLRALAGRTGRIWDLPLKPVPSERSKPAVFAQVAPIPSCEQPPYTARLTLASSWVMESLAMWNGPRQILLLATRKAARKPQHLRAENQLALWPRPRPLDVCNRRQDCGVDDGVVGESLGGRSSWESGNLIVVLVGIILPPSAKPFSQVKPPPPPPPPLPVSQEVLISFPCCKSGFPLLDFSI